MKKNTKTVCDNCGHGIILHGNEHGRGYCMEYGECSLGWCECTVKGLSYDEEIELLKREDLNEVYNIEITWP